jgi:PKD repeat protein
MSNPAILTVNPANRAPVVSSAATATPNPLLVGQYTAFSVAASDPDGDTLAYSWNYGDGTSGTGASVSHAYTTAGTFTAKVTITDGKGGSVASQLTVTVNTSTAPYIVSFTLMNADTDQPIPQHDPLLNGATIDLAALPTQRLNVRANVSPATVGSVRFSYDAIANYRTESVTPYALAGDTNGNYYAWTPSTTTHTLTATPYSGGGISGTAGTALTIRFNVVAATATDELADLPPCSEEIDGPGDGGGGGGTPEPQQIIDLGTLQLNARAKIQLPVPETMTQYRRLRGKALSILPPKLRASGSKLTGKATATGVFEFTIDWETRVRMSDENGKRIERLNVSQRYRITVVE